MMYNQGKYFVYEEVFLTQTRPGNSAHVDIVYDGPALQDGQMNVRDLASSMLAVGALFDSANQTLNGSNISVDVNVRATKPGSFHILYEVIQPITSTIPIQELLSTADQIKNLLFGSGASLFVGLFFLVMWLRGRKPKVEKINNDLFRLTIDNQSYEVPLKLLHLYQDVSVRRALADIVRPVREPGIDVIEVREDTNLLQKATKDDISAFDVPEVQEPLLDETSRHAFSIISLAFKEDNKWRLTDGKAVFHVSMKDTEFQKRVDNNEIAFAKGDILVCDLHTVQWQIQEGVKTEYEVVKVLSHRPARQLPMIDLF